jgi:glucose/arabinose dehydrogenase
VLVMARQWSIKCGVCAALLLSFSIIPARCADATSDGTFVGQAAFGDWRLDAPGVKRKIEASDLPRPLATELAAVRSEVVKRPDNAALKTPPGFNAELFATGLAGPRVIRVAPNGDIFIAESQGGQVRAFRAGKGDNKSLQSEVFAGGLERPYGIAFYPPGPDPRYVYISTVTKVLRYPYRAGELKAARPEDVVVRDLPGADGGHWTRDLAFSPDGKILYVAVGSKSNAAEGQASLSRSEIDAYEKAQGQGASWGAERDRADVLAFDPDGEHKRTYATGIRNCSGLTIRPETAELWCAVNERDMLGDNLPPDYVTRVKEGAFYGWPWFYIGANADPRHAGERPELSEKVTTPDVLIQPHSAPLSVAFYNGSQFPAAFKGDAFVALHGSWNRAKRTGHKIVRLKFENGRPTGEYEDFLTGFVVDDKQVWGRPVGVAIAADGSLLVSDDGNGSVWRVSYSSK